MMHSQYTHRLIWGATGQAQVLLCDVLTTRNIDSTTLFDPYRDHASFAHEHQFLNALDDLLEIFATLQVASVAIGGQRGQDRHGIANGLRSLGIDVDTLQAPTATVSNMATLGQGVQLLPRAVVNAGSHIGTDSIVNTGATVDHGCQIGRGVHIMGAAALAGEVRVGDFASIGTNATILPGLTIGPHATVGAGAVVTKNVASGAVVTGVPARSISASKPPEPDLTVISRLSEQLHGEIQRK